MTVDSKSKFTKLIAVRFTEQELARLEAAADEQSVGASTLVRMLVNQALKPLVAKPRQLTSDEFREVMVSTLRRLGRDRVDSFFKDIAIGNPDDPTLLVWAGKTKRWEDFTSDFLKALLSSLGVEVSFPASEESNQTNEQNAYQTLDQTGVQTGT